MSRPKSIKLEGVTINRRISESVARNPDNPAISCKTGKQWRTLSYREFDEKVRLFSLGLRSLGLERGDRIALLSENRPEWAIADVASLAAGAVTVPIYSTLPPAQVAHILADSGARAILVSDSKQFAKLDVSRSRCAELALFISMEPVESDIEVLCFDQILELGKLYIPSESYEDRRNSVRAADLASLVYTSGTTGEPKGTMLSHQNFAAAIGMAEVWFPVKPTDTFLSFLPLCHVFERVTHYLSLTLGTHTYYAESIFKVQENLAEVQPVIMQSVPRLFEAVRERVMDTIEKAPHNKRNLAKWALAVGTIYARKLNNGKFISPVLAAKHIIADKLVLSKIRQRLGGKLRFFVSGGAPLSRSTADFFHAINIPILEGYGMTETTAPLTCNIYHRAKVGTVGKAFPSVQLMVAEDGEILAKGPNVMAGYWNNPGATHEMFDDQGWLCTGDIGKFDSAGYLTITDRKKDIIVLANGKNVAPQPIEGLFKQSRFISEVVLFGDKSGTISALVIPNLPSFNDLSPTTSKTADQAYEEEHLAAMKKTIKVEMDRLSVDLAEFEKVRKFALLLSPLSIENGELTPTMKVRRGKVFERHGSLLDK
jgi:long-chain acyl-CoA synthetase